MGLTKVELKGLDDGTDGQIITYDANGNPVAVGPGTDGQVLTSTGAGSPPAFEDAAAGVGGATGVDFNNDVKARWGTDNDLEIKHAGDHNYIWGVGANSGLTIGTNATSALTVDTSQDININAGNIVFATAGKGIDFSAAAGSNAGATASVLDDYEEGTWDPYFSSGTGGGSLSNSSNYAEQKGKYVKVGNLVTCQVDMTCASSGTGSITGELRIDGLPFGNGGNAGVSVGFGFSQNLSNTHPNAAYMFSGGGTHLWLQERTPDNGQDPCDANQVVNNSRVVCGVTYRTT